ncbi:hypothetical protein MBLNU230_g2902t2 [Neophaeotheca triangularis]
MDTSTSAYGAPAAAIEQQEPLTIAATPNTLRIALQNQTDSNTVFAYITGQAIDNNNALILMRSDARTPYYPSSPSSTGQPIGANIAIPLGRPGNTVTATIPRIAGGRIWFSVGRELTFLLNPGPGLVEPSVFNPADPNVNINFGFAEFTFNSFQVFANISYVDFVSLPVSLTLRETNGRTQHVSGLPENGLQAVCEGLRQQTARDGRRWSSLIVNGPNGQPLRALSPNSGILLNPSWFETYYRDYINTVYSRYATQNLTINTQASFGNVRGRVGSAGNLNFGPNGIFPKPTARDIFSCSTGPFATGSNAAANAIIPRLAAAFNRSTLLLGDNLPNDVRSAQYYTNPVTNHYSRIVHATNLDGKGYAFPYDDVTPDGAEGQEGAVFSGQPELMTLAVGGRNAYVG